MFYKFPPAVKSIARLFILQQFASSLSLIGPVYVLAMADHQLSGPMIASLMCCLYITSFIFEIPSGVWADQYSRRKVLLVAELICASGFAVMGLFPNVIGFAVGMICLALRASLYSGTYDAYMYDELAHYEATEHFGALRSLTQISLWLGVTISSVGLWVYHDYGWEWVAASSVLARLLGFAMLWRMPEVGKVKRDVHPTFRQQVVESLQAFRQHKSILWIGIYTCSLAHLFMFYDYRSLLATEWHLSSMLATLFVGGCSLAYCLGSAAAVHWKHDTWPAMLGVSCLACFCAVLSTSIDHAVTAACLFILALLFAEFWLIRTGVMLQHATPSPVRASTGSMINFGASVQDIALAQLIGFMAGNPPVYLPTITILNQVGFSLSLALLVGYLIYRMHIWKAEI